MATFRKGNIVRSGRLIVLVSGQGNKKIGYPCFAGTVLVSERSDDSKTHKVH